MSAPAELRSARLLLRDWRDADLEPFAKLNADPQVMRYFRAPLNRADSDAFAGRIRQRLHEDGWGLWAVEVVGEQPFIGFVGLARQTYGPQLTSAIEVGWRLAREVWGRGYAPEAARAVLEFAFGTLNLDQVVSITAARNTASRRVMTKLGLTHDPAQDYANPALDEGHNLRPTVVYRLTAAHYHRGLPSGN
jgi:RimJ/RimL family protein N-acetyltransferase